MDTEAVSKPVRLLIVDDHSIARHGLRRLLSTRPEFEVVADAEDGAQAITLYRQHRPDVVLMDLRMTGMSGVDAIGLLRAEFPDVKVLVFSSYEADDDIRSVCEAGIMGYVSKGDDPGVLLQAIAQVASGHTHLPGPIWQRLLSLMKEPMLTRQERTLLKLVSDGLRVEQIAEQTRLTAGTVKVYISRIVNKLDAKNRAEAIRIASERGLI